jgi:hypothetical protein
VAVGVSVNRDHGVVELQDIRCSLSLGDRRHASQAGRKSPPDRVDDLIKNQPQDCPTVETPTGQVAVGYDEDLDKALELNKAEVVKLLMTEQGLSEPKAAGPRTRRGTVASRRLSIRFPEPTAWCPRV